MPSSSPSSDYYPSSFQYLCTYILSNLCVFCEQIGAKEMLKAAGVKQAELGAEQEAPAKEADPNGIPAVAAPVASAAAPALDVAATSAPKLPPPTKEAIKVVKEQADKLLAEKAAAKAKKDEAAKAIADRGPKPGAAEAKRAKLAAAQAAANEAKEASDAKAKADRQAEIQKEAEDKEEQRATVDSTDPARTSANKAGREAARAKAAKENEASDSEKKDAEKKAQLKAEYNRGVKDGKKMLDSWKTNAAMSISNAITMANKEAPHTREQTHDLAKAEKAAQSHISTVADAEKAAANAALAVMTPEEKLAKANKEMMDKKTPASSNSTAVAKPEADATDANATDAKATDAKATDAKATDVLKPGKAGTEATEKKVDKMTKQAEAAEKADQAKHKADVEASKTEGKKEATTKLGKERNKHLSKIDSIDTTETHAITDEEMKRHKEKKTASKAKASP